MGSGFNIIPSPPPNGRSSTTWCLSVVHCRRSCAVTSTSPALRARRKIPQSTLWLKNSGKIVMISKRSISKIQKSFRRIDDNHLPRRVHFNHDRISQRYQSFLAAVVGHDENLSPASFKNRVDLADAFRADLDRA